MNTVQEQMCPFCPLWLPADEERWSVVREGYALDGVGCCDECALFAGYYPEQVADDVAKVKEVQR